MNDMNHRFHAGCLRQREIAPGPGEVIVVLREPIRLEGRLNADDETRLIGLNPGMILHADAHVDCVREAIDLHLNGPMLQSEVRFGAGILLGIDAEMHGVVSAPAERERLVDRWLDRHALFVFQYWTDGGPPTFSPPVSGLLNGVIAHWQSHKTLYPS